MVDVLLSQSKTKRAKIHARLSNLKKRERETNTQRKSLQQNFRAHFKYQFLQVKKQRKTKDLHFTEIKWVKLTGRMFKPIEFYFKEKIAAARLEANAPVNLNKNELRTEYLKLKDEEILKYVKEAEVAYDTFVASKKDKSLTPFSYYLTKNELDLLMASYGLPEKIPT